MPKRLLNPDVLFAFFMLAVSVMFFVMGSSFNRPTADGSIHEGFFPQIIASVVALMSLVIIIGGVRKPKAYFAMSAEQRGGLKILLLSIVVFLVYIAAWPFAHFILLTTLALGFMCRIFRMTWKFTALFSVLFSTAVYFLFTELFSVLL